MLVDQPVRRGVHSHRKLDGCCRCFRLVVVETIASQQRGRRVRFVYPVRVTTTDGAPRAWKTVTTNLSHEGVFVRMPQPLDKGTRVALSLEVQGQVLPLAEGEVRWCRFQESELEGRFQGCGVRFTDPLHPRSTELVQYLVDTLQTGKPLRAAPKRKSRRRWAALSAAAMLAVLSGASWWTLRKAPEPVTPVPSAGPFAELAVVPQTAESLAAMVQPAEGGSAEPEDELAAEDVAVGDDEESLTIPVPEKGSVAAVVDRAAAESERVAAERVANERAASERAAAERVASERVANERAAASAHADSDRIAAERAAAERVANERAATERADAERAAAERVANERIASDRAMAERAAAQRAATERPLRARKTATPDGQLSLPSGAATAIAWSASPDGLDVRPQLRGAARVVKVFPLADPPRLVFDIEGDAPQKSHSVKSPSDLISRVRLGKQGATTRVVVDFASAPQRVTAHGDHAIVRF